MNSSAISDTKVKADFGNEIGTHISSSGAATNTSWGIIHSGGKGAHIVPALPDV